MQRQPDISLAQKVLDWQPKISRKKGMKKTYEFFKSLSQEDLNKSEHKDFSKHFNK